MIIALHGFLGLPSDWNLFETSPLNLYSLEWTSLKNCAAQINAMNHFDKPILMGYSLGGRLALHALIQEPSKWSGGIIISAHPGLSDPTEKTDRLKRDEEWALKFEHQEWASLMNDWNNQEVFKHSVHPQREEKDYDRSKLAAILRTCSLGKQEDLREQIRQLQIPLLWIAGEKDPVFSKLAREMELLHSYSHAVIVPNASHRVVYTISRS